MGRIGSQAPENGEGSLLFPRNIVFTLGNREVPASPADVSIL